MSPIKRFFGHSILSNYYGFILTRKFIIVCRLIHTVGGITNRCIIVYFGAHVAGCRFVRALQVVVGLISYRTGIDESRIFQGIIDAYHKAEDDISKGAEPTSHPTTSAVLKTPMYSQEGMRWGHFIEQVLSCNIGFKVDSAQELNDYLKNIEQRYLAPSSHPIDWPSAAPQGGSASTGCTSGAKGDETRLEGESKEQPEVSDDAFIMIYIPQAYLTN